MRRILLFSIVILSYLSCKETKPKSLLEEILASGSSEFKKIIDGKDKYEVQILFSPISQTQKGKHVEDHFFNFRPDDYFYPASSVKMPVVFLALQKLNELKKSGVEISLDTPLSFDSLRSAQTPLLYDSTSVTDYPSIGHFIDQVFATSNNEAYNRLYEFVTQDYINSNLRNKGIFTNSRIVHRVGVSGFSFDENKWVPSINFLDNRGNTYYKRNPSYAQGFWLTPISNTQKGVGHISPEGTLVKKPFDFNQKNFINIRDLQESLKRMILSDQYSKGMRYDISEEDKKFVLASMARLPKDYPYLQDELDEYYDSYVKFFLFGDDKSPIPDHIIIRNKVGYAYGYLTDCAYIQDTKEDIEYFLTATIHVNDNRIYNDGIYEYDEVGIPFLAELGRLVHQYMIDAKKANDKI